MWCLFLWGVLQACSTQGFVLLAQQQPQRFASPGYPGPYLKGQESTLDIEAPEGLAVRLIFQDFDLETSPNCEGDAVTISAGGKEMCRLCGQLNSAPGSFPAQREFVSPGRRLQLSFHTRASCKDQGTHPHKGFLALYQAVAMNAGLPSSRASRDPETVNASVDGSSRIQSHCREPYYQAVFPGTATCAASGAWKDQQEREEVPHCVPVCGRPVTPIIQDQTTRGSSRAKLGNFPWQAFTSIYGRGGGALLGDRWILTAAHTIHPKDSVSARRKPRVDVYLGHTDIEELLKLGSYPVRRMVVHPDYHQGESHDFNGDIALLELQQRVTLGPHLLPVCLPDNETLYEAGVQGYISGFGMEMGRLTTQLKYSRLPVAPREACEAWLREKGRMEVFSENMICVGGNVQRDSGCQGDSGSVYVVWDARAHRWVATGIVSWGVGCATGYGFYTKVLNYVEWIKAVTGSTE